MGGGSGSVAEGGPHHQRPVIRALLAICATAVLSSGVVSAWRNLSFQLPLVFKHAHQRQVPPALHELLAQIRRAAPRGERFIWINRVPDRWYPLVWQRLLYPDPMFILQGEEEMGRRFEELRRKYRVRFVFSSGLPPVDPGYAWRTVIPAPPGSTDVLWFGELRQDSSSAEITRP